MAVINGMAVTLGGKVDDSTLVKLSESQAVLQGASGKEVLELTPAAEKQAVQAQTKGADMVTRKPGQKPKQVSHD